GACLGTPAPRMDTHPLPCRHEVDRARRPRHDRRRSSTGAVTSGLRRRAFLSGALVSAAVAGCSRPARWDRRGVRQAPRSRVAIVPAMEYAARLVDTVLSGVKMFALDVARKTVVLKPNFVEFDPVGVVNTNPALVAAAIEAFRCAGAREVIVAEGP